MSAVDLRTILADPDHSGAYFIDVRDADAMAQTAQGLDFAVMRVDLAGCTDKDGLMSRLAKAGGFPDDFGANWDALSDALRDMAWRTAPGYVWLIENASDWRDAHHADFDTLLEILNEAAFEWAHADVAFWALLPFPGDKLTALED
ncbi:barstar family protein [Lysobacter auxotrophicus]|uniref:Barstar family protein n=1 Tax=Lysobacter auxotrophicus TaxID=2992573 RepID=A0ABM8DIN5_9GAMM|nr:barstar family protein [Lysobacter auxotrophicus]BDU18460.1 barstar family protein [Lysobacter auxotrophicus]